MKKIRRAAILLLVATSVFATSVFAAPSIQELEEQKDKAEKEVKSLQEELTDLLTEINRTERKLVETGEAIILATEQLEEAEENEERQYENMMKRIVVMYENGNENFLTVLLESGDIADFFQRMENIQALHTYDRNELKKFVETKEEIANLKASLESDQAELQQLQAELTTQEASLNQKIRDKENQVANFKQQLDDAIAEAANNTDEEEDRVVIGGRPYTGTGDQTVGDAIVASARSYIGVWYLWGGNDRNGIDCSGLTKAAHKAVGITIDRWSGHQAIGGKEISGVSEALPGDIICYSGHVAIYIGNERVIHAPRTGKQVQEATVYMKEILTIRRYW